MNGLMKGLQVVASLAAVILSTVLPLPLEWTVGGILLGLLLFQLALVGTLTPRRRRRRYLALRATTDRMIALVRELNEAVLDARAAGVPEDRYAGPFLAELHDIVDDLPRIAGREIATAAPEPWNPYRAVSSADVLLAVPTATAAPSPPPSGTARRSR